MLSLPGTRTRQTTKSRDVTHATRSVPLIPRPVEVCTSTGLVQLDKTTIGICYQRYLSSVQPSGRVWYKVFFRCPGAGPYPRRARQLQKYLGPRRHSPKNGCLRRQAINLIPPRRVKAWGGQFPEARGLSRDETHPTRSVPLIPRPAKMWPIYCIGIIGQNNNSYLLPTLEWISV